MPASPLSPLDARAAAAQATDTLMCLLQLDVEQYYINRGEFDPKYHLQYLTGYKNSGGNYVSIDRLLKVGCMQLHIHPNLSLRPAAAKHCAARYAA